MYIQCENTPTRRLGVRHPDTNELVYAEFNDNGIARVQAEVGEIFVEEFDNITVKDRESKTE